MNYDRLNQIQLTIVIQLVFMSSLIVKFHLDWRELYSPTCLRMYLFLDIEEIRVSSHDHDGHFAQCFCQKEKKEEAYFATNNA